MTSLDFTFSIGFAMTKLCRTRPQPGMRFLKHWKNCVGSNERISGSAHEHIYVSNLISDSEFSARIYDFLGSIKKFLSASTCTSHNLSQ